MHETKESMIRLLRDPYNTSDLRGTADQIRLLEEILRRAADFIELTFGQEGRPAIPEGLKRYNFYAASGGQDCWLDTEEDPAGEWVRYSDLTPPAAKE